ncbi:glycosyltransferase family 4 protein [Corynebacterium stationis]|uniref:glycosyltransferase family 4 protein n=1 Tax=Corynebacterium stationis TaxID=1705 RepID=UPI00273CE5A2|nr:glycosyltransferase family 4 protein [Corynebacterium stationis]WLP87118.1 glycosyltransferase family 4 protein [Corynebacterium stationis]
MKVLIVSQYYPPERSRIPAEIAQELNAKGHDVRVLTGYPNYPEGKIFPGYKQKWRSKEQHDEVEVLRVPLWADHSTSPLRRILNYMSFAFTSATASGFAKEADVIYVYATQMTPALGPWLWKRFRAAPYVLHVQDLWPDSILESSMIANSKVGRIIRTVLDPWLRSVYSGAAGVIGIAPTMVKTLVKRGSDENKTVAVYNWADDSAPDKSTEKSSERTEILFAGNIGDMQDLETVVRAAKLVEDIPIRIAIVGDGVARDGVMTLAKELGTTNVDFRGAVPRDEMPKIYSSVDFSLVTLRDLEAFRGTIPSKFQASIAHGVPVITTVQGDLRRLVEEHKVGFTADVEDAESLSQAMRSAHSMASEEYSELQKRTRNVYLDHFSRRAGIDAVETVLTQAASSSKNKDN